MKNVIFALIIFSAASVVNANQISRNASQLLVSPEMRCVLTQLEKAVKYSAVKAIISKVTESNIKTENNDKNHETITTSDVTVVVYAEQQGDGGNTINVGTVKSKVTFIQGLIGSSFFYQFGFNRAKQPKGFDNLLSKKINLTACNSK